MAVELSRVRESIEHHLAKLPAGSGARRFPEGQLITLLQELQRAYGWLPREVLEEASRLTGIPRARVWGIVTFYAQFYLAPRGRHIVRCCRGTACHVKGAPLVREAIEQHLKLKEGETSPDYRFTYETTACFGTCFLAPVMMVGDRYYGELNPERVRSVLESFKD